VTRPPRSLPLVLLAAGLLLPLVAIPAAAASAFDEAVEITFPVAGLDERHFTDDYDQARGGGTRVHRATDIGSRDAYGLPVHAAMGGTVSQMTGVTSSVPSYGYMIVVTGDDGRRYSYLHLGRQDGPPSTAYAAGLERGDRVERGQHIGYVGHSGNASESFPHLHFEIEDTRIDDPYGSHRMNPYNSLVSALQRGDVPRGLVARGGGFTDVPSSHTHAASIDAILEARITQGCAPQRFCPANSVTRGQMASFLARALGLPLSDASPFSDVPTGHPHGKAIAAVAEAGISRGDEQGRFRPDQAIRRDQMASLLAAALELEPGGDLPFSDVSPKSVHAGAIAALAERGIARGSGDGRFQPARSIDRGQMASFLDRSFLQ
jgi:hypothetical protein